MNTKVYVIAGTIHVRESDLCIWCAGMEDSAVILTALPGRLLLYLLKHAGRVVERNELLTAIWEEWGLEPSGHSLSQNISQLRRLLSRLDGSCEIIETLPRIGYKIPDTLVTIIDADTSTVDAALEHQDNPASRKFTRARLSLVLFVLLAIAFSFFTVTRYLRLSQPAPGFAAQPLHPLGTYGNCKVYSTMVGSEQINAKKMAAARRYIDKDLPCLDDAAFLIHADDAFLLRGKGRMFLSRCFFISETSEIISGCESVYEG